MTLMTCSLNRVVSVRGQGWFVHIHMAVHERRHTRGLGTNLGAAHKRETVE